jgi:exodeoxyribonuclease V alpha subunit
MQIIESTIEEIIYQNKDTGYCVAALADGGKAVGIMPELNAGADVALTGEYVTHPVYGRQFRVETFTVKMPATVENIKKYLSSGMIKGIRAGMAEKIVRHFGKRSLEVMDNNIDELLDIEGIGEKKLLIIKKSWDEQRIVKDIMMFLQSHNISPAFSAKIYKLYGKNSISIVSQNPYRLTNEIWGIGFKTADLIGKSFGFENGDPARLSAGVLFALREALNSGHTYLPLEELYKKCGALLNYNISEDYYLLKEMEEENKIVMEEERIYLSQYYNAERYVENKINNLNGVLNEFSKKEIDGIIINPGFYSPEQIDAISYSLLHKIIILTGGPGTGKTTALKGIISAFLQLEKKIMLAAPTGRAAKRMSEVIGLKAGTIHRLLEYNPNEMLFQRNEHYPLECGLLIIDEVSMIDTLLFYNLLRAVTEQTTIVLVGDSDQLPPVGAGSVLKDLLDADIIPSVRLAKIFRQAEESRIIINAHKINEGIIPDIKIDETSDFFFINESDDAKIPDIILDLCKNRLPLKYGFDPMNDIQTLTPMYKGVIGADNLNLLLQSAINSGIENAEGKKYKTGDKVMQLKNNYTKEVFNGDIGFIKEIDRKDASMNIEFGGRGIRYEAAELEEITLAYAITVHKSQGSEYPCVIMPLSTSHYIMLQRNLLYTAVTRASKLLILIGSQKALSVAVNNKNSQKRYTSLFKNIRRSG